MNLGSYIKELESLVERGFGEYPVYKEYGDVYEHMEPEERPEVTLWPAGFLQSWRGDYAKLSIPEYKGYKNNPDYVEGSKWKHDDPTTHRMIVDPDSALTVEVLLEDAKNADGNVFEGYKGGDFTMYLHTGVYADNYSHCPGFIPVKLDVLHGDCEPHIIIRTIQIGWDY